MDIAKVIEGRYVLKEELGRGGLGVVYAAHDERLGREVALKLLLRAELAMADPEALTLLKPRLATALSQASRQRFFHEARALARIDSPHSVRIHDLGVLEPGVPFIVMERLRGMDLGAYLAECGGPLPPGDAVGIGLEIATGAAHAHAERLIHRDLKPQNVFLHVHRGRATVKLLDFGIAKGTSDYETLTRSGDLLGSLPYMSPEQLSHAASVTVTSDIWSIGVTLYEALTGVRPFRSAHPGQLLLEIQSVNPPLPSSRARGIGPALDALVLRCLEKDPAARFATADALVRALESCADGELGVAALAVREGWRAGAVIRFPLTESQVFGSSPEANVRLGSHRAEPRHFRVRGSVSGLLTLEDLGSRDGTTLNGRRVGSAPVRPGDLIGVAGERFEYLGPERPSVPLPPDLERSGPPVLEW
ncbi:MAG: FHA domain-containing serine/threonine-protein kinase [Sorangiineae bacterium]|nr:FHA domain-containing serine/threonine-protein kinase [Polyangiaceae bacterium]MEB2324065.1 FHA domain-containing serine/threonine-protein kinase [Sorangiineae bacterium]